MESDILWKKWLLLSPLPTPSNLVNIKVPWGEQTQVSITYYMFPEGTEQYSSVGLLKLHQCVHCRAKQRAEPHVRENQVQFTVNFQGSVLFVSVLRPKHKFSPLSLYVFGLFPIQQKFINHLLCVRHWASPQNLTGIQT